MPSLRLISFDAAGTLIRVREPVGETYAAHAARFGVAAGAEELMRAFRALWVREPPPLWPEGQVSPDDDRGWWRAFADQVFAEALGQPVERTVFEPLFDGLYRHYAQAEAWVVYEDVMPALETLAAEHELCVLSNFDRRLVSILEGHRLARFFRRIILSSEVGAAKPHPRMFETAQGHFSAQPAECLHVGDDERCDVVGAINNGWHAFGVNRPESGLQDLVAELSGPQGRREYIGGRLFETVEKDDSGHIPACNRPKFE